MPPPENAAGPVLADGAVRHIDGSSTKDMVPNRQQRVRDAEDDLLADLSGAYAVRVEVGDRGSRRTYLYRSLAGVERMVARAEARGRAYSVALVLLTPVEAVNL